MDCSRSPCVFGIFTWCARFYESTSFRLTSFFFSFLKRKKGKKRKKKDLLLLIWDDTTYTLPPPHQLFHINSSQQCLSFSSRSRQEIELCDWTNTMLRHTMFLLILHLFTLTLYGLIFDVDANCPKGKLFYFYLFLEWMKYFCLSHITWSNFHVFLVNSCNY